jgi:hypothetical protein
MALRPTDKIVRFEGAVCTKATEKALLCVVNGEEVWIPQSQIADESEVFDDTDNAEGTLVVSEWIATQKGLI